MKKLLMLTLITSLNYVGIAYAAGQTPKDPLLQRTQFGAIPYSAAVQAALPQAAGSARAIGDSGSRYASGLSMGLQPQGAGAGNGSASGSAGGASIGGAGAASQSAGAAGSAQAVYSHKDVETSTRSGILVEHVAIARYVWEYHDELEAQKAKEPKKDLPSEAQGRHLFHAACAADGERFVELASKVDKEVWEKCVFFASEDNPAKNVLANDTFAHVAARHKNALAFFRATAHLGIINSEKNSWNRTPLEIAQDGKDWALAKFLEQYLQKKDAADSKSA